MYRILGRPAPRFVWCDSPMTAMMAIHVIKHGASLRDSLWVSLGASLGASLRDSLWVSLGASLRDSLWDSLGASLGASLRASLGVSLGVSLRASLWVSLGASLGASLRASLGASLGASLRDSLWVSLGVSLRASLWDSYWGQQEQYWIGFYQFAQQIGVNYTAASATQLQLWADIAASAGWWWPYAGTVIISERATMVHMEPQRADSDRLRLHCAAGPAVQFRDGWGVWAWHGVRVPQSVIEQPDTITAAAVLAERNVEVARVMLERMGIDRFIAEANAVTLHEDTATVTHPVLVHQAGCASVDGPNCDCEVRLVSDAYKRRLLSVDMPSDPDQRIVAIEVACPSTGHHYLLRVPPTVRDCTEAVAWTFGLEPKDYAPLVEA